jgi:hypothetical protein
MSYYLRVFCPADELPPMAEVLRWVDEERGITLDPTLGTRSDSHNWRQVELERRPDRIRLLAEASTLDDQEGLAAEEIQEFLEALEDAPESAARAEVAEHLRATRTTVALQPLGSDVADEGYAAASALLAFFVERCGGLVQADGEGFYRGDTLVVELE